MRKLLMIVGLIFGFWLFMPSLASAQALGNARLSLTQGDVVFQNSDTGAEWGAASVNTPLMPGTKVWVPENGKAEIQFLGGSYLRADENTDVEITDLKVSTEDNIFQVGVLQGRTYINYTGSNVKNSIFQVDSPIASIRAYGPAGFGVDVNEDGYTEVSAFNGAVYVEGQSGETKVDAGSMLSIGPSQTAELSPLRQPDSWDRWNQLRDSALAKAGPSKSYLPGPLVTYSSDFDSYGHWVNTPDYGHVWTPYHVAVNWAPYRLGRWCWVGGHYVWVSHEPWGWVPYHYGRWSFITSIGWCWVPPPVAAAFYWSPGFVAWISTPTYVSWVPLAPGEIYYGYGHYGPHSVNITRININRITINKVYVNARVRNAVTVLNRETFITGRPLRVWNAPVNPFASGVRITPGRPDIKPVRASALPHPVKVVPQRALPPRQVVEKAAQVERRPVAVNRGISVFKPGERVAPMRVTKIERPKSMTVIRRSDLAQPSVHREEMSRPFVHAPGVPPVQSEQQARPPTGREALVQPPVKRGEVVKPQIQREQQKIPSAPREQLGKPPVGKEEINRSPVQGVVRPPAHREEMVKPPAPGKQMTRPPVQREEMSRQPMHREMGVAPRFEEKRTSPPVRRERMNRSSEPRTVRPPAQREKERRR